MLSQLLSVVFVNDHLFLLVLLILLNYLLETNAPDTFEERRIDNLGQHPVGLHYDLVV